MANRLRGQDPDYVPATVLKEQSKLGFIQSGLSPKQYAEGEKLRRLERGITDYDYGYNKGFEDALAYLRGYNNSSSSSSDSDDDDRARKEAEEIAEDEASWDAAMQAIDDWKEEHDRWARGLIAPSSFLLSPHRIKCISIRGDNLGNWD